MCGEVRTCVLAEGGSTPGFVLCKIYYVAGGFPVTWDMGKIALPDAFPVVMMKQLCVTVSYKVVLVPLGSDKVDENETCPNTRTDMPVHGYSTHATNLFRPPSSPSFINSGLTLISLPTQSTTSAHPTTLPLNPGIEIGRGHAEPVG